MRYLIVLILVFTISFARENPFEPVKSKMLPTLKLNVSKHDKTTKLGNEKDIVLFKWLSFKVGEDYIFIKTKDNILRKFKLTKPKKIVLDFRPKRSFKTKRVDIKNSFISKIEIGSHKNYYRVVLNLKKDCRYKIKKEKSGYRLIFR